MSTRSKTAVVNLRHVHHDNAQLSDEAIARACATSDPQAIAELFARFNIPVTRYLGRLLNNREDVADLLQATFLEVTKGHSVYDAERASVLTWLFSIATNKVRHHRRSFARRQRFTSIMRLLTHNDEVAEPVEMHDLGRAQQALMRLPEAMREAFVLCELEGFSAREAAEILSGTEARIWKRVSRARKILRACLEQEQYAEPKVL